MRARAAHKRMKVSLVMSSANAGSPDSRSAKRCTSRAWDLYNAGNSMTGGRPIQSVTIQMARAGYKVAGRHERPGGVGGDANRVLSGSGAYAFPGDHGPVHLFGIRRGGFDP